MTERSGSTCECDPERPRPYETAINCPPIARQEFDTHASYTSTGVRLLSRQLSGQTARPLGVIRRDVLLQGYQCGVGGLSTVELFVCHPLQLLGREVHVPRSRAQAGRSTGGVPL